MTSRSYTNDTYMAKVRQQESIVGRAKSMITAARHREKNVRKVPAHLMLVAKHWLPAVVWDIAYGPYADLYDLTILTTSEKEVRNLMAPSISRRFHSNPVYTNNFMVEPWVVNQMRGQKGFLTAMEKAKLELDHGIKAELVRDEPFFIMELTAHQWAQAEEMIREHNRSGYRSRRAAGYNHNHTPNIVPTGGRNGGEVRPN